MTDKQDITILRNLFTGLQAETISRYAKAGILNDIEGERVELSLASGEKSCQMLGVTRPEEAFLRPAEIVECASWDIASNENGLNAISSGCKLAAICKKLETPPPCSMYCLSPIEGMIKALKPEANFNVRSTLFSEKNCTVEVTW